MSNTRYLAVRRWLLLGMASVLAVVQLHGASAVYAARGERPTAAAVQEKGYSAAESWIIRWNRQPNSTFAAESDVISEYSDGIMVARPRAGAELEQWLSRWANDPGVEYLIPNGKVQASAVSNDPFRSAQKYLDTIRAPIAWDEITDNTNITIAVIDTGVDLEHPDLKDNLVEGYNLIDPSKPPQDDNGHGTNVAGVLAAAGSNKLGTTGVLWKANIMPIKALDSKGAGDEDKLGEAIRYAVNKGCKVVVLSLGLLWYSPYMRDIVQYAENSGVLLVAASGNEAGSVKYPAAYPTVLAIGGMNSSKSIVAKSNRGPELDLVAPWDVYTTAMGGDYEYNQGTSMAAPQAAGVAALIWAKYPKLKPYEVRDLLRQSAEDLGTAGWDPSSGYGLLRADKALAATYQEDMFESNDTSRTAKPLSIESMHTASFEDGKDADWYAVTAAYAGTLQLEVKTIAGNSGSITMEAANKQRTTTKNAAGTKLQIPVEKGRTLIRLQPTSAAAEGSRYTLTTSFQIYRDSFESNDKQYAAYSLSADSQKVKGTFHQIEDEDWFVIQVTQPGTMRVKAAADTTRIDLHLAIAERESKTLQIDIGSEGDPEQSPQMDVQPGKYYVQVRNVISSKPYPVTGEYTLEVEYTKKLNDPHEPNDKAFQAVTMSLDTKYSGVADKDQDTDWYKFSISESSLVHYKLTDIPSSRIMLMVSLDQGQKPLWTMSNKLGEKTLARSIVLNKGTYYVKLSTPEAFQHQYYHFTVSAEPLVAGFSDIKGHWAQKEISELTEQQIIGGYGDYTFRPEGHVTRAEAVSMLVRALKLNRRSDVVYPDVSKNHWAAGTISIATEAGIVRGYADGRFLPDKPVTRAEMAAMTVNAFKLSASFNGKTAFQDVGKNDWYASAVYSLWSHGLTKGYGDGTFRPEQRAERAEFAMLLYHALR